LLFQSSLLQAKLPGGLVLSNCKELEKKQISFPKKTNLNNILIYIDLNDPSYTWELHGGILNLLPKHFDQRLLNVPIKRFKASNVTVDEAINILLNKSEVKRKITEIGLNRAISSIHIFSAYIPKDKLPRFNFEIKNNTLKGLLNEIVKVEGQKSWVFVEKHCNERKELSVYLVG
jgi:hypothetical protein